MAIKISVIVTAYNRMEFLSTALNSLVDQTLEKDSFEVLLLTNFEYNLEKFNSLDLHHYILDGSIGEYMYQAIKKAKGEIVTFLDDDDVFMPNKLLKLVKNFDDNFVYYKNSTKIFFDESFKRDVTPNRTAKFHIISEKDLKKPNKYAYNKSSISLKKEFIMKYLDKLKFLEASEDWFFFFTILYEDKCGVNDPEILSLYRKHLSSSSQSIQSSDQNYDSYLRYLDQQLASFSYMKEVFPNSKIDKIIDYQLSVFRIRKDLLSYNLMDPFLKPDTKNIFIAILLNYNNKIVLTTLFLRSFVAIYWRGLYSVTNRAYILISRRLNRAKSI